MRIYPVTNANNNKANKNQTQRFGTLTPDAHRFAQGMIGQTLSPSCKQFEISWLTGLVQRAARNAEVDVHIVSTSDLSGRIGLQRRGKNFMHTAEHNYWDESAQEPFLTTLERFVGLAEKEATEGVVKA